MPSTVSTIVDVPRAPRTAETRSPASAKKRKDIIVTLAIVATILALIAGGIVWYRSIKREYYPRNFGVVKDGAIYRSGQNSARVLRELCEEHKIKTIVNLSGAIGADEKNDAQRDVAADLGVERFEFMLPGDGTGDPAKYLEAVLLMADPARQPVLVHCSAGAQRTSTAVILYRTIVEGRSVKEAYEECFSFKHEPDEWILLAYVADNLPAIRAEFNRRHALAAPPTTQAVSGQ